MVGCIIFTDVGEVAKVRRLLRGRHMLMTVGDMV